MALKKCPECGQEVSDQSTICVHCGFPFKQEGTHCIKKKKNITIVIFLIIALASVFIVFINSKSKMPISVTSTEPPKAEVQESRVTIEQEASPEPIKIKRNQTVSIHEVCSFAVSGYDVTSTVLPPNISGVYRYFEAPADSVFVDVEMQIKNLRTSRIAQNQVIDSVKILYDNDYEYFCNFVVENDNGSDLSEFTSIYAIEALQTLQYHMIAVLPASVKEDGKPLQAVISVDGEEYLYNLR